MNDRSSNLGVTTSARGQPRRLCEKLPADRGSNATFEFDCTERGRGEYASIVTESSSHVGEAFVRRLSHGGHEVLGLDIREGRLTTRVGSITDRSCVSRCTVGEQAVFHAAILHRPHVDTHSRLAFVDTNIAGTVNLLEAGAAADVESFVFTSTTSVCGRRTRPARRSAGRLDDRRDQAHSQTRATDRPSAPDLVPKHPLNDPRSPIDDGA